MRASILFLSLAAVITGAACYTASSDLADPVNGSSADTASTISKATDGLPCSVADVLAASCLSCHGSPQTGGAPNEMLTYADLTAPSTSDPTRSVAAVAVERMRDAQKPMPPSALPSPDQVSALDAWISAGMPNGTCATAPAASTAAVVCTSNKTWTRGDRGSSSMHPGVACIACHDSNEGPRFTIAGTLFPTVREPDDCYGTSSAQIVVTDASGRSVTLTPNSAGNFSSRSSMSPPYQVKIVSGSKVRAMNGSVQTGDCNGCHTQDGAQGAPGRIMVP